MQKNLTLFHYITTQRAEARARAGIIFRQICYNLDYLHNHLGIAHCDIKLENILLNENKMPILGDLGTSQVLNFPHDVSYNLTERNLRKMKNRQLTYAAIQHLLSPEIIADEAHNVLPQFCAEHVAFHKLRSSCLSEKHGGVVDIYQYVAGIQVNCGGLLKTCVELNLVDQNKNPLIPLPTTDITEGNIQYLLSPYCKLSSSDILFKIVHSNGQLLSTCEAKYMLENQMFHLSISNNLYAQLTRGSSHFTNFSIDDRIAMVNFTEHILTTKLGFTPEMIQDYVYYEIEKNSPPALYSDLTPNLSSTLALRPLTRFVGTKAYAAPELLTSKPSFNPLAADIWSLGVVLFMIIFGVQLYSKPVEADTNYRYLIEHGVTSLLHQMLKGDKFDHLDPSLTALLEKMLCVNPTTRYTVKDVIKVLPNIKF